MRTRRTPFEGFIFFTLKAHSFGDATAEDGTEVLQRFVHTRYEGECHACAALFVFRVASALTSLRVRVRQSGPSALGVILFNHSDKDFEVKKGDRVAQMILERITTPEVVEVEDLEATDRGEGGFGSTGV